MFERAIEITFEKGRQLVREQQVLKQNLVAKEGKFRSYLVALAYISYLFLNYSASSEVLTILISYDLIENPDQ